MSTLHNRPLGELLEDNDWQRQYAAAIRAKAAAHRSFIAYQDEQGRYVREYPASGEVFEIGPDWQQLTLLSIHGVPVPGIGFQA